ncbi:MAG: glutamate--tRNA ligase [Chitinispirillaceae bacterium]|nr:glutamate--tRNA ligase [Chitinispirillaceae bacterium]
MSDSVRVRFAPSPTGYLHVGGARSALFNYLFARHHAGTFILRIEDTDRNRFVDNALDEIYESLTWLGITWDEGPGKGGSFGPYIQSERLHLYKKHVEQLVDDGHAYYCFCSSERLARIREEQEKSKTKIGYDRHCLSLSKEEVKVKCAAGEPYVIRFRMPSGRTIKFNDFIRGDIEYQSDILDDFVLLKTDGYPTYHLANVVDDHLMEISHVLRGDEWIASTPRHVLLYEAFGWEPPQIAHLPVILSSTGGKLSKRKGAASVMDYQRAGYLPEALVNFLALLGWNPGNDREKMTIEELHGSFSLEKVSPKAAVFDEQKLEWMNGLYMAERPVPVLTGELLPLLVAGGVVGSEFEDLPYLEKVIGLLRERSKRLTDLVDAARYFFVDPESYEEKADRKHFTAENAGYLQTLKEKLESLPEFSKAELETALRTTAEALGVSTGKLIHPVRLAVSGVSFGPGLFDLLELAGRERVLRRIDVAVAYITKKNGLE